jgi:hypothetical protein
MKDSRSCFIQCIRNKLNELHRAETFLRSLQLRSYFRISQHFMEPEGSLPCSLAPILGQIAAVHTIPSYLRSILILSSHLRPGLPSGLFPSGFPTKILHIHSTSQFIHSIKIFKTPDDIEYGLFKRNWIYQIKLDNA